MLQRYLNEGYYEKLHADNVGKASLSLEEIEKDLNRSLPEYSGYQTEEGINALRRVLYVSLLIKVLHCSTSITGVFLPRSDYWILPSHEYRH